jgi:hypothetical protein
MAKEDAMTERKTFKRRVRERMSKTGESYTAARTRVVQKQQRNRAAHARLADAAAGPTSDDSMKRATGKTYEQWFAILDRWGARDKKHTQIARYVQGELGVDGWWSQAITVGYERARGMRVKYQQADGFSISASKTVAVPVAELYEAVVDDVERKKWLPEASMSLRVAQRERSARFDWEDGSQRVNAGFTAKGDSKSMISIAHERLGDADEAETAKVAWKERLVALKEHLETRD